MRLHATLKNERGGKKSTSDDTRILVELNYKNKFIGTIGLYSITDNGEDLGYRVVWDDPQKGAIVDGSNIITEQEKGKS